jgi:uncharacterized protein
MRDSASKDANLIKSDVAAFFAKDYPLVKLFAYCKNTIATANRRHSKTYLSEADAFKGIDYFFHKYVSVFTKLTTTKQELLLRIVPPALSWYGGEPFLNFELIQKSAAYFKSLPWGQYAIPTDRLKFSVNTNLSIIFISVRQLT